MKEFDRLFIGGSWVPSASKQKLEVVSPSTEEVVGSVPLANESDVEAAADAAREAFDNGPWPQMTGAERADYLRRISKGLEARREEIGRVIVDETGLPTTIWGTIDGAVAISASQAEIAENYLFEEPRPGQYAEVVVRKEPVGVVAAINPWNAPLSIGFMKLAPALMAGCTVVFKPAEETPLHAFMLAEVLEEVGLPPGVVNILPAMPEVSSSLVTNPKIDKVSFTGSTATGRIIATLCAQNLKRCSLELGGKSAAIVLDDVDLTASLPGLIFGTAANNGEACALQSRLLAPQSRYSEVVEAISAGFSSLVVGDPHDPATNIGPLINSQHRARVEGYIESGKQSGARVATGGGRPADLDRGYYVQPTVFADATNDMPIAQEEIFGPVLTVIPYSDDAEALAIANDSPYGLSGSVWTADPERGAYFANRVRTGNFGINTWSMEASAPFGGFKESGIGREQGREGLEGFLEMKAVHRPLPMQG